MDSSFFLKGIILGFSIAAAVGPIGFLCVRKTIQFGRLSGLFSGLGAAVADTVYGFIAALGLTSISNFLLPGQFWLRLVGGAFLIYLGIRTFIANPYEKSGQITHKTLLGDFVSTFFLTMVNPLTILSFLAIFAGLGLGGDKKSAGWLVLGVFMGSTIWWILLSEVVMLFRKKVTPKAIRWVNRCAGTMIFGFGIVAWLNL